MARLILLFFGGIQIKLDEQSIIGSMSKKEQALLAYLAIESDYSHDREKLAGLLWTDQTRHFARRNFNQCLATLRKAIGDRESENNSSFLLITRQTVQFNPGSDYSCDVVAFNAHQAACHVHNHHHVEQCQVCMMQLQPAVELYHGDLLEGISIANASAYEDWLLPKREWLRRQNVNSLEYLTNYYRQRGEYQRAQNYAHHWFEMEPLIEAPCEQLMLLLTFRNRRTEALLTYEKFTNLLYEELEIEPSKRLIELYHRIKFDDMAINPPRISQFKDIINPYKGLNAFQEADAVYFYGREKFIEELRQKMYQNQLAVVMGASGSGKSSVIFAGLIPNLRLENDWYIVSFRPGKNPIQSLAAAFISSSKTELDESERLFEIRSLVQKLEQGNVSLLDVAQKILHDQAKKSHFLIVIDQFEELYTFGHDLESQYTFLDVLLSLISQPKHEIVDEEHMLVKSMLKCNEAPTHLVLTMRTDFLAQAITYRPFADIIQDNNLILGPMTAEELKRVIITPAQRQGITIETHLVSRLLDNVGQEPGNLPLLQFALDLLWKRQTNRTLTHVAYEAIGGIDGALSHYADRVFYDLSYDEQKRAKSLFLQLIYPGLGTADTRRVAQRSELGKKNWRLAQILADARLVVTNQNVEGIETAELTHESLIQHWGLLQSWLNEGRVFRIWQEQLRLAINQWQTSNRDEDVLLRGNLLAEAQGQLEKHPTELSSIEKDFIMASVTNHNLEKQAKEQYKQHELEQAQELADSQKLSATRLRYMVVGLLILSIIIFSAAMQAYSNQQIAIAERNRAENQADLALSRQLAQLVTNEINMLSETQLLLAIVSGQLAYGAGEESDMLEGFMALSQMLNQPAYVETILMGHTGWICGVAWSHDESRIATGGFDNAVHVWDSQTGEEQLLIDGFQNSVCRVGWSHDDTYIFTFSAKRFQIWDSKTGENHFTYETGFGYWNDDGALIWTNDPHGTVQIRDVETGEVYLTLTGHATQVLSLKWSHDGNRIVTSGEGDTIRIWDSHTGKVLRTLEGHTASVHRVTWSKNDGRILSNSNDNTVRVWDSQTGKELLNINHTDRVLVAKWNKDETQILTTNRGNTAQVWDANTGEELLKLDGHTSDVQYANWYEDETQIITAGNDNTMRIWHAETGKILTVLSGSHYQINHDETQILTASTDGMARIMRMNSMSPLPSFQGHVGTIWGTLYNDDESQMLSWGLDKTARVWDAKTGQEIFVLKGHAKEIWGAKWNPDESRILTYSWDGTMRIWDGHTGKLQLLIEAPISTTNKEIRQAHWSRDGKRIVACGRDGMAGVWDSYTGEQILSLNGPTDLVIRIMWNHDESLLLTTGYDKITRISDAKTGEELVKMEGHTSNVLDVLWSPDESRISTASQDGTVRIWDSATGKELLKLEGHKGIVWKGLWNNDGTRILTYGRDGTFRVWDSQTGEELMMIKGHDANVFLAKWNQDETKILSFGFDEKTWIWHAETGEKLQGFHGMWATWDNDEDHLLVASSDGSLQLYHTDMEAMLDIVCQKVGRNLSIMEWKRFIKDEPFRKVCPDLPLAYLDVMEGHDLVRRGKTDEAIAWFEHLLEIDPMLDIDPQAEIKKFFDE